MVSILAFDTTNFPSFSCAYCMYK